MRQACHPSLKVTIGRYGVSLLFAVIWLVFFHVPASAHRVMIFAWIEGDTVYTQSKFSGGKRVKNSVVVVYDNEGNRLVEGTTDDEGEFAFKVPKKTDLKIVLNASMGHMAEWEIPVEEIIGQAQPSQRARAGVEVAAEEAGSLVGTKTSSEVLVPAAVSLSREEIKVLIDESLDRKLAPLLNMLADSLDRGPRLNEVIGGIGYIFGLIGVAFYVATRRKRK